MDTLKAYRGDIASIIRRSFNRAEYTSGLTSLIIILTLILIVRFGANIYLFFSIGSGGNSMNFPQIWGGFLFIGAAYMVSGAFIQGYKVHRFLDPSASVFQPRTGKRFFGMLRMRVLMYRPLAAGIFSALICFGAAAAFFYGTVGAVRMWGYFLTAFVFSAGGYFAAAELSYRFRLEEFEARLLEVLYLAALVLANPDFVRTGEKLSLGFYLNPVPFDSPLLFTGGLFGIVIAAVLIMLLFYIGRGFKRVRGKSVSGIPLVIKLYVKIVKPRYWMLLAGLTLLIGINIHLLWNQKLLLLGGLTGTALLSFTIFLFFMDMTTREEWRLPFAAGTNIKLLLPAAILHAGLSALPWLVLLLIQGFKGLL